MFTRFAVHSFPAVVALAAMTGFTSAAAAQSRGRVVERPRVILIERGAADRHEVRPGIVTTRVIDVAARPVSRGVRVYERGFDNGFQRGFDRGVDSGFDRDFDRGFDRRGDAAFVGNGITRSIHATSGRISSGVGISIGSRGTQVIIGDRFAHRGFVRGINRGFGHSGFNRGFNNRFDRGFNHSFNRGFNRGFGHTGFNGGFNRSFNRGFNRGGFRGGGVCR